MNAPLLNIGTSKETVLAAQAAILSILDRKPDPAMGIAALRTLRDLCHVKNVTVSGCTFQAPAPKARK